MSEATTVALDDVFVIGFESLEVFDDADADFVVFHVFIDDLQGFL